MEATVHAKPAKKKRKAIWKPFLKFYTKFKIPWWLFIISAGSSLAATELGLQTAKFEICFQKGQLYNSVILGYVAITLAISLIGILTNMTSTYGTGLITVRAREVLWRKMMFLPSKEYDRENPSSMVSRISADIPEASSTISMLSLFVSSLYGVIRAYCLLYGYCSTVAIWFLAMVPVAVLEFWIVGFTQFLTYRKRYTAINSMMTFFSEHLAAVKHFKAQTMEELEREEGFKAIEKRFWADCHYALMVTIQVLINSVYTKLCTIMMVFGAKQHTKGTTDEDLVKTTITGSSTYLTDVQKYLAEILTQYQSLKGVQGALDKVVVLSETMGEPENPKSDHEMPEGVHDIVLNDVCFGYTDDQEILHHLSFTIPGGKKTAIVGDNGCGKSTLFKLLMRFYEPQSGDILYGDETVRAIHKDDWRTHIGYVLQSSPLFSGTIRDNIVYAVPPGYEEADVIQAAKVANAYDFIMEDPEGFDKEVGEGGTRLSGGQRQRIAIARAVMQNPEILLMDEATASLDYQSDHCIWEATQKLMKGRTTIVIAHDMKDILDADQIVVLHKGNLEACGKAEDLVNISPTFKGYVSLQMKKEAGIKDEEAEEVYGNE